MLEANEINPNVSEDKLTMDADDEEDDSKANKTPEGEKILKGLTMEVTFLTFTRWKFTRFPKVTLPDFRVRCGSLNSNQSNEIEYIKRNFHWFI